VKIARDKMTWQVHMKDQHGGIPGTWTDQGIRGGQQTGFRRFRDDSKVMYYAPTCYGCGATFSTSAELITHLLAIHGAS